MKITDLHIENFRCFKEAHLRIAPITLVTGPNSAGKSSLFASVLATAQTDGMPVMLSPNGRYIDMGDYSAMVHRHRLDSVLSITFDLESEPDGPTRIVSKFSHDAASRTPRLLTLSYTGSYYDLSVSRTGDGYDFAYNISPSKSHTLKKMLQDPATNDFYDALTALLASTTNTAEEQNHFPSTRALARGNPEQ